jgi:hypothetical protein
MNPRVLLPGAALLALAFGAQAANQTSQSFRVVADVFCFGSAPIAVGSARYQSALSAGQFALSGEQFHSNVLAEIGFQASGDGPNTDDDGVPDGLDGDDDGDGLPDASDPNPYDTDNDGRNNLVQDDDDDNDGFSDAVETGKTGTDPLNASSYLGMLAVRPFGVAATASWMSVAGRTNYWLQRTRDLKDPEAWVTIAGPLAATGSVSSFVDPAATNRTLYRVIIP